ncbi:ABC transporter permease [Roseovarius aquimarinus]|uniref:ABC transporter permease n=1 Tax=Roseovarius aquimarinus TaxID=1229156 RepID=A0ABW7I656_9RHOB
MTGAILPRPEFRTGRAIVHFATREVRKPHSNVLVGLVMETLQAIALIGAFWVLFMLMGMGGGAIRGDFLLYTMTGVFLFLVHTKAVSAVVACEGAASPMLRHHSVTAHVLLAACALGSLYKQLVALGVILSVCHLAITPIEIHAPAMALAALGLAWLSGCGIGLVLLAGKPWAPSTTMLAATVYARISMIASGKMFVANTLPSSVLVLFDWNPLFHTIDQARGHVFVNYAPQNSNLVFAVLVSAVVLLLGLAFEYLSRKRYSQSRRPKF